jgi:hypothetical protein
MNQPRDARVITAGIHAAIHSVSKTLYEPRARASMARGLSMTKQKLTTSISRLGFALGFALRFALGPTRFAAALTLLATIALTTLGMSPARADRCDDLANQLKGQIDGLGVGKTAANLIYLSHPQARQITLGCAGRNFSNQLFARADSRKPKPAFLELVASAAAIVFTLPKDDMLRGATRCIKRMGIFRGDDVKTRYRRLDMNCSRTKTDASITISRGTDQ